jgi:hypothetical protein
MHRQFSRLKESGASVGNVFIFMISSTFSINKAKRNIKVEKLQSDNHRSIYRLVDFAVIVLTVILMKNVMLEKNLEKISWRELSQNPSAIHILEKNHEKIDWCSLSTNRNAIHILEKNPEKIDWFGLSSNPNAMRKNTQIGVHYVKQYRTPPICTKIKR